MNHCEHCGKIIPTNEGRGRARRYCDATCRQRARREGLKTPPWQMLMETRWVRWKPVERSGKITKMPIQPDGLPASSTDPATWTDYEIAESSHAGVGMGFVLGDGFACIDLDHCYDRRNHLAEWARQFTAIAGDTFIEISPSGDGLHIWGLCEPRKGLKVREGGMNIEAYSQGRYITVTGRPYKTSTRRLADITMLFDLTETIARKGAAWG